MSITQGIGPGESNKRAVRAETPADAVERTTTTVKQTTDSGDVNTAPAPETGARRRRATTARTATTAKRTTRATRIAGGAKKR
jgi:hypothetical protein